MSQRLIPRHAALLEAYKLLPARMDSARASILVLAISLQEDPKGMRFQVLDWKDLTKKGPAKGLAQFEKGGGVAAVMRSGAPSEVPARALVDNRGVRWDRDAIWRALEVDDVLAMGLARCLLWNLPGTLPSPADAHKAWSQYVEAWGPGKPHPEDWPANHAEAVSYVTNLGAT